MTLTARAKINWYLKVLGKRPDGYHELEMLMQHIDLSDELEALPADGFHLTVQESADKPLPSDDSNLVLKAAYAMRDASKTSKGASFILRKHIPLEAGLGGGSADAAAAILALNKMWELDYPLPRLQEIGLRVGADVPYCLIDSPAIVRGIGEIISPVYIGPPYWIVLLKPKKGLSTKEVFKRYASEPSHGDSFNMDSTLDALLRGDFARLSQASGNSLQKPAEGMLIEIACLINRLRAAGAAFAQMTGSGSAVFGAFTSYDKAVSSWEKLKNESDSGICILTRTIA